MSKPSDMACYVDQCPECGRIGEGVYYKPRDPAMAAKDFKEFVVNHCINNQKSSFTGHNRNDFCWTGEYDKALEGEYIFHKQLRPIRPPDWKRIKDDIQRKRRRQTRLD